MTIPRPEHPRPQFRREDWLCLNGEWGFERDPGDSGRERGLVDAELAETITVPFCPESELSGIGCVDFMNAVWYRRRITVPPEWAGSRVLLHFQAVDHDATVWVDGEVVGSHRGGWTPFAFDLTERAAPGSAITVRARDPHQLGQAMGKQSHGYANRGCHYTRTTGIWQTVWLERVPATRLERPRITPDLARGAFVIEQAVAGRRAGLLVRVRGFAEDIPVGTAEVPLDPDFSARLVLELDEADRHVWSPSQPFLYDLVIELLDAEGRELDRVSSYAGLRAIAIEGQRVLLNGEPVFQRLVLDQGYYPDGIMTAPSDEALARDIELSLAAGFNGARLHQKVFEERFLYHADRLGYLVWGEFGDWSGNHEERDFRHWNIGFLTQWIEVLERDYSHPSIVGWCPLNETLRIVGDRIDDLHDLTVGMYRATKLADRTRPVLDASGYNHDVDDADVYDCHDYVQDPDELRAHHAELTEGKAWHNDNRRIATPRYRGQPFFVSEFGGTWWNAEEAAKDGAGASGWGYGQRVRDIEEFYARFEGLCAALLENPGMFGYCYTQLTDVFQEQNGIYGFDRGEKFDAERLRAIQTRRAAIEGPG